MEGVPKVSIGSPQVKRLSGLKNRGEIVLECADCGTKLMKLLIGRNNEDLKKIGADPVATKVQVRCELCGGKSYVQTVEGAFYPGAHADDICFDVADSEQPDMTAFRAWRKTG